MKGSAPVVCAAENTRKRTSVMDMMHEVTACMDTVLLGRPRPRTPAEGMDDMGEYSPTLLSVNRRKVLTVL